MDQTSELASFSSHFTDAILSLHKFMKMLDSEAPEVPYHEAPEVCYAHSGPERVLDSEAPEVPYHEAPEVYYEAPEAIPTTISKHDSDAPKDFVQQRKTQILGLSPVLFWASMALTLLILGGAIGGGVGGSAAQRQKTWLATSASPVSTAKGIFSVIVSTKYVRSTNPASRTNSKSNDKATLSPPTSHSTSMELSPATSSPISSDLTSDTVNSLSTIIPSFVPPNDSSTGCPASNGTIYSSQGGARMLIVCGGSTDPFSTTLGDNIMEYTQADSMNHCLERCITWNRSHAPPDICHTVGYWTFNDPIACYLANVMYPGHNIGNDFGNEIDTAYGFLLDDSGNIIQQEA